MAHYETGAAHYIEIEDGEVVILNHLPNDPCVLHCRVCHFRHCKEVDCPKALLYPPMPVISTYETCGDCGEPYTYIERREERVNHARLWTTGENLPFGM